MSHGTAIQAHVLRVERVVGKSWCVYDYWHGTVVKQNLSFNLFVSSQQHAWPFGLVNGNGTCSFRFSCCHGTIRYWIVSSSCFSLVDDWLILGLIQLYGSLSHTFFWVKCKPFTYLILAWLKMLLLPSTLNLLFLTKKKLWISYRSYDADFEHNKIRVVKLIVGKSFFTINKGTPLTPSASPFLLEIRTHPPFNEY